MTEVESEIKWVGEREGGEEGGSRVSRIGLAYYRNVQMKKNSVFFHVLFNSKRQKRQNTYQGVFMGTGGLINVCIKYSFLRCF